MSLDRTFPPHPLDHLPDAPAELRVTSQDFADSQPLPESAGYATGNTSPQLAWTGAPEGTRSFLLVAFDPDAPVLGGFRHWAVAVIPADVTSLPAGATAADLCTGGVTLTNDYGTADYGGCAPPEGDPAHRYVFTVWALDTDNPGIDADTSIAKAQFMSLGHVLARGSITGTFQV